VIWLQQAKERIASGEETNEEEERKEQKPGKRITEENG
jgi:hypothetical protein